MVSYLRFSSRASASRRKSCSKGVRLEDFPLRRLIARARKLVENFGGARHPSNERVHLLVADVEAAELIERETIARAQTKDLAMQEDVEALEFVIEVSIDQGASG